MIGSAPRVVSWSLHPVRIPYRRNVRWASLAAGDATFLLLLLRAGDGNVGVGEMHVSARWFGTTFRTLTAALEDLFLPMLPEIDLRDPSSFARRARAIPEHICAKALVDNALHDLAGAVSGTQLGNGSEPPVAVSWILTRQSPELMAAEAAEMAEQHGFRTFKLKGGQGLDVDLDAVRRLRALVSDAIIYLDCNREYDAMAAPAYLTAMAAAGAIAVEDPYRLEPNAAFERIQAASPIPMILDITAPTLHEAELFCERGARAIALKPGRAGLSEAFAMADHGARVGCPVFLGSAVEGHIGSLAALAAAARLTHPSGWLAAETAFFLMFGDHVTAEPIAVENGCVTLPGVTSLAQLVDWERVERLRA